METQINTSEVSGKEKLKTAINLLGITMVAKFIPFSQSRNAKPRAGQPKPWLSLNWEVKLMRNGREFIATDYSAGSAHCPGDKSTLPKYEKSILVAWECENGVKGRHWGYGGQSISAQAPRQAILPELESVMHSLITDAGVLDFATFEIWADEFGFDADSRSAETTYRNCLETALKLRAAIGDAGIEALREAGQDY